MAIEALKKLAAYEMLENRFIEDLNSTGIIMRHKKTGARVALLSNDDENKVFYIGFRTPPADSTGVAHIVEHTVLCGSKNFPVKDPFIELAKGSLNTFLNAMTYPDKTVYPVASCNDKDFKNLMHVYLDAVFYPNIYKEDKIFKQEGWHYELHKPEDALKINGVVYSEMKGAFSSPDDILEREIMNSLYPDTSYGVESGGHPDVIPMLTYEAYLDFHKRYYHPSNSYIYLYGNMDMAEQLRFIDENYLNNFDYLEVDSMPKVQPPFEVPREREIQYPVSDAEGEEGNAYLSYNVACGSALDRELYIALQILDYAVCSAPGAPLKKALIDAGIGKDVYSIFENGILQPYFSVIAKNTDAERKDEFVGIIEDVLGKLAKEGVDRRALYAAIASNEFRYREADFGSYPKGLIYGLNALDSWLYDDKLPFWHIEANATFAAIKSKVESGYFEKLISEYLLNNTHKTIVYAVPKKGLTAKEEQKLAEQLQAYKETLTDEEIAGLIEETEELRRYQETPDSEEELAKIPLLARDDIRKEAWNPNNIVDAIGNATFLKHEVFTNGIAYLRIAFDANHVPERYLTYLGLLQSVLGYMDTAQHDYGNLSHEILLITGGLSFESHFYEKRELEDGGDLYFEVRAKVLYENMQKAFALMEEILFETSFADTNRLYEIIAQTKSRMQSRLMEKGHTVAASRAITYLSHTALLSEQVNGLEFYYFIDELEKNFENRKDELVEILSKLVKGLLRSKNL
ncbi:MAG: insulinase family protein, partial [Lachnospiraceae bacterium]|nr:insulinase family protein [Lachnospiraceae bacterium]